MKPETAAEVFKAAPPIIASVLTLNNAVLLATFIYIIIQAFYLLRKWWREEQDWEPREHTHERPSESKDESIHG